MNYYFAAGDAPFYFAEQLRHMTWLPTVWHLEQGFGTSAIARLWYDYPVQLFIKFFSSIGASWWLIDKILWMLPVIIGIISSWKLVHFILRKKLSAFIASVIYVTNTYFLLLFGGGQLGVALGYGLAPYVLLKFILTIDAGNAKIVELKQGIINGLWLALLVVFDLRLAYLIIGLAALYYLLNINRIVKNRKVLSLIVFAFIVPGIITVLVHLFWILPTIMGGGGMSGLGAEYTGPGMLKFLSVADYSHAFALLHPNWPENLFGKVYFLQPEFLVLPILAFSALLFVEKKTTDMTRKILFFVLLAVVGAFFAKGVQAPFGGIFQWMFVHVPGFIMFRDPTKFYLYVAIGYSILVPYTFDRFTEKYFSILIRYSLFFIFVVYWCFTIRPVFLGQMRGNFQPMQIPAEYTRLKDMLVADSVPSRTLWIPQNDPFVYMSDIHPMLTSNQLFNNASISAVIALTRKPEFMKSLDVAGVGYVVVPIDLQKNIFLPDYRFNSKERSQLIDALKGTSLILDTDFTGVAVYRNSQFTMTSAVPSVVVKQQKFADIGFCISVITLLGSAVTIILLKRRE